MPRSEESKQKSSDTQRKLVEENIIKANKAYIYNINTYTLACECNSTKDARKLLRVTSGNNLDKRLIQNKYIISFKKFENLNELVNFIFKFIRITKSKKYLIREDKNSELKYYRSLEECLRDNNISRYKFNATISKNNPLIIRDLKFYYSFEYIPVGIANEEI